MNLNEQLKIHEGTQTYQTKMGYFKNGKYWTYSDSLGYPTIGYGHLVIKGENFSNGLTPQQADALLDADIQIAKRGVATLGISTTPEWNDFLVIMVFQLGLAGVKNFRKMIAALKVNDYPEAARQCKDSRWYKQTPNRVNEMLKMVGQ
ncbi:glycoside hydrolase family protein [Yersinia enterocolitica]